MPTPGYLDATAMRYVDVGCYVWSRTRGHDGVEDDGVTQVDPIGGLVVDVSEMIDHDTAEVVRAYVVADTHRGRIRLRRMPETDVNRETVEAAAPGQIAKVWRLLCAEIAYTERRQLRTGIARPEHITMTTYAHRLAGLL
ncbi:MAG TPA: hypothetical protein VFJ85_02950 [Acidimicrobiales bacterium]|nr:hypothetical protein [Acidimicrobiales bacterium]